MPRTHYISDPTDFCRACKGTGDEKDESPTGAVILDPCYLCGGSGNSSVRVVLDAQEVAA